MAKIVKGFDESQYERVAATVRGFEDGSYASGERRTAAPATKQFAKIPFHNNSGEVIPAWGVMRITGMTSISGEVPKVVVAKPSTTLQRFYLVNSGTDCAVSADGWGTYLWHSQQVAYDTGNTPAIGETWGPQDGAWTIKKNRWGFNVIGGNAGTGAASRTWAIQNIVNGPILGKTNASHAKSASGTVNLYTGTLGSETQVTSMTVTAYNRFAAVGSGKWVHVSWMLSGWDLAAAEC